MYLSGVSYTQLVLAQSLPGGVVVDGMDDRDSPPPPPAGNRRLLVKVFLQGYYLNNGSIRQAHEQKEDGSIQPRWESPISDRITVRVHSGTDYSDVLQTAVVFLYTDGKSSEIPLLDDISQEVWISVRHRNHLETVYFETIDLGAELQEGLVVVDFTTAIEVNGVMRDPSYGENQHQFGDGRFGVYTGDVNQDGYINITDRSIFMPVVGQTGYHVCDLDGNGYINITDRGLLFPNIGRRTFRPN
jgi:hypothetical protein